MWSVPVTKLISVKSNPERIACQIPGPCMFVVLKPSCGALCWWDSAARIHSVSRRAEVLPVGGAVSVAPPRRTPVTPWTGARQGSLRRGFSRQEYCSGLPFSSPGDLLDTGVKPTPLMSPALTGGFFTRGAQGPRGRLAGGRRRGGLRLSAPPLSLPAESLGRGSLAGCRPEGHTAGHGWGVVARTHARRHARTQARTPLYPDGRSGWFQTRSGALSSCSSLEPLLERGTCYLQASPPLPQRPFAFFRPSTSL